MGQSALEKFMNLIKADEDFELIRCADREEDYKEHWDVLISYPMPLPFPWVENYQNYRIQYKTEVKAMKRVRRQDEAPTDETIVIEIKGVQPQNKEIVNHGWLYGKADAFAFEMSDGFWLIPAHKLRERINEIGELYKIDYQGEPDLGKGKKLYKLYGREGRGDKFIYVRKDDLRRCNPWILREDS